jgi:hypothetical protein
MFYVLRFTLCALGSSNMADFAPFAPLRFKRFDFYGSLWGLKSEVSSATLRTAF